MVKWMKKPIAKRGDRILEENRKKKKYESKIELEDYVTRDNHGRIRKIHIVDYLDNLTRERLDLILEKDEYYRNRIRSSWMSGEGDKGSYEAELQALDNNADRAYKSTFSLDYVKKLSSVSGSLYLSFGTDMPILLESLNDVEGFSYGMLIAPRIEAED